MTRTKKLIEVAMPVKEISAESVRDKSIRHGHISTLHLWWARRPLPVCRAVVFASLVPDPLDPNCPQGFIDAIEELLGKKGNSGDPYKPYLDIPYTAIHDPMEDNLRNRLMMFIGKFSEKFIRDQELGKTTSAKDQLSDFSLIKWDNKNNETIINKARKLIWVAFNSRNDPKATYNQLSVAFDNSLQRIKIAENALYETVDRHIASPEIQNKEADLNDAIEAFLSKMPKVFDPFAGGGAIPLEAARLGCRSYGNDINPVAHIIQKGSVEYPQKFGKPVSYSLSEFEQLYGEEALEQMRTAGNVFGNKVDIDNRLSYDVGYYAKKLLDKAEVEIGQYYPDGPDGKKPIAYYWARVGKCANPSCGAKVPLLKQFYLANKKEKQIYLNPIIKEKEVAFEITNGECDKEGWMNRGNLKCPCCYQTTDVKTLKKQFRGGTTFEQLLAVITEGIGGKDYRLPFKSEIEIVETIPNVDRPREKMPVKYTQALPSCTWDLSEWGQMFTPRQLLTMQTFVEKLQEIKKEIRGEQKEFSEYAKALITYLSIWVDRIAIANTSYGVWHTKGEKLERPMGRQAIPMVFDFPESNSFCESTGSARNQLSWIIRYIGSESSNCIWSVCHNASSGERNQFESNELQATITDPPYYDAIAYADLSDFFYIWLKRTLNDIFPINFATPLSPKAEECTALKHHHENNLDKAFIHFDLKLLEILTAIEHQTEDIVSIMFAHQSTRAWATLCNSIIGANMNIVSSWANDTEQTAALKTNKAFLSSSITVACIPTIKIGIGEFKEVQDEALIIIKNEVNMLYNLGFRGADLLTACFGKAVSVFGQYESVEKADGSPVTVAELLEMARDAAFNAIVSDIVADEYTRFYIGWLNLFGFAEADHDDVRRIIQIGLSINADELIRQGLLVKNGDKERLAAMNDRVGLKDKVGLKDNTRTIDIAHRMMYLFTKDRITLIGYVAEHAATNNASVWRVLNSLIEVMPKDKEIKDYEIISELLSNKGNLIREAKHKEGAKGIQNTLDL